MELKKCPECGGRIVKKRLDFFLFGENLGKFDTMVCQKCKEKFYDEEASDEMEIVAKKRGLWGLESQTKLSEVGNSLAIRLNKKLIDFFKFKKGREVIIYPENKERLVVEVPKSETKVADK